MAQVDTEVQRAAERQRIADQKLLANQRFDNEKAACYQKFSVTDCVIASRNRRNEELADLKRQEVALNDVQRKQRGAEQMRKTEEKTSPEKLEQLARQRAKGIEDARSREQRLADKAEGRSDQLAGGSKKTADQADKLARAQSDAQKRHSNQGEKAAKRARYEERQRDADLRKAELAKKNEGQTKTPSAPLPTPP